MGTEAIQPVPRILGAENVRKQVSIVLIFYLLSFVFTVLEN